MSTPVQAYKEGVRIRIYLHPRASRAYIKGIQALFEDRLQAYVKSPPVEGAANKALIELLADTLSISKSRISILAGDKSRKKDLYVKGGSLPDIIELLTKIADKP